MFKKEAEERARKLEESLTLGVYDNEEDLRYDEGYNSGEVAGYEEGFQDGAEFGYNKAKEEFAYQLKEVVETCNHWQEVAEKANEWHYVKDELPIGKPYQHGTKAFVTVTYINNYNVPKKLDCYYWDNEFLCDSIYGYKKVENVYGKVYAWKYEDKLPELPKE